MAHRILFVDAASVSAMRWHRGQVEVEEEFAIDDDGLARFGSYVSRCRESVYLLLADVAEEAFQFEEVPFLRGRNRIALIKRKLARYYPGTPFTAALPLDRRSEGRRDERMLFSALTRPQQFEPWLKVLKAQQAALAGLFAVPQILASLNFADDRFLLITVTRAGLRQTFIEQGRMRFSRLTPANTADLEETAAACARETAKTFRYLEGQGWAAPPLAVQVLVNSSHMPAFRARCADSDDLHYRHVDLQLNAARCGLKTPLCDSNAEPLLAHLLMRHTPRGQFAHADARRVFRLGKIRTSLRWAGNVVFGACLLFAAVQLVELEKLRDATATLNAKFDHDERRYREMLAPLPELPLAADKLAAISRDHEHLLLRSPGPAPLYRRISAALDDNSQIELQRLDWSIAEQAEGAPGRGPYATADIEATLPGTFATDVHEQARIVGRFADGLRRDPAISVHAVRLPSDEASAQEATGTGDDLPSAAPRFTLRIVQRLEQQ